MNSFDKKENTENPEVHQLHVETENLAMPEVHSNTDTGVDITDKDEEKATHTTIDYSGAMPEIHFRKK